MSEANKLSQDDLKTERYLPHSRIRTIMKSSADPSALNIKEEALQIVSRATVSTVYSSIQQSIFGGFRNQHYYKNAFPNIRL